MNIHAPKGPENFEPRVTPTSKPDAHKKPYIPNAQPPIESIRDKIERSIQSVNATLQNLGRADIADKFMATLDEKSGRFTINEMVRLQTTLKDITQEHVRTDGMMDPRTIGLLDRVLEQGKSQELFAGFDKIISVNNGGDIVIPWYDPTRPTGEMARAQATKERIVLESLTRGDGALSLTEAHDLMRILFDNRLSIPQALATMSSASIEELKTFLEDNKSGVRAYLINRNSRYNDIRWLAVSFEAKLYAKLHELTKNTR